MSEVDLQSRGTAFADPTSEAGDFELAPREPSDLAPQSIDRSNAALGVAHVVDAYSCYPGERVTFFTRVDVRQSVDGFTLRVVVPYGLVVDSFGGVAFQATPLVETASDGTQFILWRATGSHQPGERFEYYIKADVEAVYQARRVVSAASVFAGANGSSALVDAEQVELSIVPKGNYLRFLPSLYENDDFLGRFLMLFESHWSPIEAQIDGIHNYFDPKLAPMRMLSWLAMWVDLRLDENWTEAKQRRLLSSIIRLYRKRGTKIGLQEYLEIFSEGRVEISERRANNFRLGHQARLGVGIALGTANVPHTFTVKIWLPPIETQVPHGASLAAEELQRYEADRQRVIRAIIDTEKPAHTTYQLEFVADESTAPELSGH